MTILTLSYRAIESRVAFINWKIIYSVSILFLLLMLVFYVFLVNELTEGAYLIKNYDKEIKMLFQENKNLEANFAQAQFLGQVTAKAKELSFEKTTNIKYIKILESSLAKAVINK